MTSLDKIKVVYLGKCGGFFRGQVMEAQARALVKVNREWVPRDYRIEDEDGDYYTVSKDGQTFEKGWKKAPDGCEVGFKIIGV